MKRLYTIISVILFLFLGLSCQDKKEFDGLRPDIRLHEEIDEYYKLLTQAEEGWIAYLFPAIGGGYTFKMNFDNSNRVKMYASITSEYASQAKESSYRIKATQVLSLYFDTYSYIHELSDPDPVISGGQAGKGRYADFEFSIVSSSIDTVRLIGNLNQSELLLVRANASQGDDYVKRVMQYKQEVLARFTAFKHYYNVLTIAGQEFMFTVNEEMSTVSFRGMGTIDTLQHITEFAVSDQGVLLREPLQYGDKTIQEISQIELNIAAGTGSLLLEGERGTLRNQADVPTRNREEALQMYNLPYQYSSFHGFYYGGEKDFLNLVDLPGYAGLVFYPRRYIDGTDVLYIFYDGGANYIGPAFRGVEVREDAILYFGDFVGYDFTTNRILAVVANALYAIQDLLLNENGFYVYRTGSTSYDLVSVADSKLWIRFN